MNSGERKVQECELQLIPISRGHRKYIYNYLNDEELVNTYPVSFPYSLEDAAAYIEQELNGWQHRTRSAFAIYIAEEFVGIAALYEVNLFRKTAKLYYWVAKPFWNLGIATKALKKLMCYAKNELQLEELKTGVLERNIGSVKVLEKNEFELENTLVNHTDYHAKFIGETFLEMKTSLK